MTNAATTITRPPAPWGPPDPEHDHALQPALDHVLHATIGETITIAVPAQLIPWWTISGYRSMRPGSAVALGRPGGRVGCSVLFVVPSRDVIDVARTARYSWEPDQLWTLVLGWPDDGGPLRLVRVTRTGEPS